MISFRRMVALAIVSLLALTVAGEAIAQPFHRHHRRYHPYHHHYDRR